MARVRLYSRKATSADRRHSAACCCGKGLFKSDQVSGSCFVIAYRSQSQSFSILLQTGADVNAKDKDGWTPLHAAVHWGEREAAQALLDSGASVSITSTAVSAKRFKKADKVTA